VRKVRHLFASGLATALFATASLSVVGCDGGGRGTGRWATTENTNVRIDWDKVNEAYKLAEGPEDFEKRVNEIYEGTELISVSVKDLDGKTQVVTGFFDKNTSGAVDEGEKIFTIQRNITGEGSGQYQVQGYGPYYGYHSPLLGIASGMMLGSMLSSAFSPRYVPVYTQPYTTNPARASDLHMQRQSYRAANPSRFSHLKASGTGRSYNRTGGGGGIFSGRSGGSRFGIARRARAVQPVRLTA
jgi:hypothetical protein